MSDAHRNPPHTAHERAHESSDVPLRPVLLTGIAMVVTAGIIFGAVALFYGYIYRQSAEPAPPRFSDSGVLPPEPRLQVAPAADLERLRSRENEALATYAWIDRDNGVVRIPIEHAMELLVERRKKQ